MKIRIDSVVTGRVAEIANLFGIGPLELEFDENSGPFPKSKIIEGKCEVVEEPKLLQDVSNGKS